MLARMNQIQHHYRGGKGRSFRDIVNLMPPHTRYVETHLGGGAVVRNKRPAASSIGIELDPRVVAKWREAPLEGLNVIQGDCHDILPTLGLRPGDLVYSDPPYPSTSRRHSRCYRHDYTERQHHELIDLLRASTAAVVISGYRCPLYDERLSDWHRTDYRATTRRGVVTECAWTNFQPGPPLHDYSYAGRDFREREALRRRRRNLVRSLERANDIALYAALADLADANPAAILATAQRIEA